MGPAGVEIQQGLGDLVELGTVSAVGRRQQLPQLAVGGASPAGRIRERFEPRFPDVAPHRCRHTFAMATLEKLVEGHYRQATQLAAATGDASGLALYLLKADPLLTLRDLLGHAREAGISQPVTRSRCTTPPSASSATSPP
ncbi:hypothetical protein [Streptomyces sp. NPDC088246]|uniref:hypothetical protein n=1 Tax=Streptomyces sp. NPDC088246 TaxID=3365842 RepID=UPI0038148349